VMSATNEPVSILVDIPVSTADLADHTTRPPVRGGFRGSAFAPGLPISAATGAGSEATERAFGRRPWPFS
jgi:hypothetical protein